jgi:hypothetical protein
LNGFWSFFVDCCSRFLVGFWLLNYSSSERDFDNLACLNFSSNDKFLFSVQPQTDLSVYTERKYALFNVAFNLASSTYLQVIVVQSFPQLQFPEPAMRRFFSQFGLSFHVHCGKNGFGGFLIVS